MMSRNPFCRPFPERPFGRGVLIGHARTAVFVFLACWLFLFDLPRSLAYGLVTFLVAITYAFVTDRLGVHRRGPRWTLARWTLDQAVLLLLVSTACFLLYNATVGWSVLNLRVLLYIMLPTVLVGLLPIIFSGIALQLRAEQDHQRVASRIQLTYLGGAAGGNTEEGLAYVHEPDKGDIYPSDALVRVHPDYRIDPNYLVAATADAQGVWLRLQGVDRSVPLHPAYFRAL